MKQHRADYKWWLTSCSANQKQMVVLGGSNTECTKIVCWVNLIKGEI